MLPTMKQATGSKTPNLIHKVSIQLALDGHSFSTPLPAAAGEEPVEVELLTPKTMLVPAELFDEERGAELLAANGMAPSGDECVVCSDPAQETVALMAVPAAALQPVAERFGERLFYTSPLLHAVATTTPVVWLCLRSGLLYVRVCDPALQLAEVIPAPDEADILYFIERLSGSFELKHYALRAVGDDPRALMKLLGPLFSEATCE